MGTRGWRELSEYCGCSSVSFTGPACVPWGMAKIALLLHSLLNYSSPVSISFMIEGWDGLSGSWELAAMVENSLATYKYHWKHLLEYKVLFGQYWHLGWVV